MRILLITLYYHPDRGGTPGVYKDLCESLHRMGHDVVVVTGFPRYNVTSVDKHYRRKLWLTDTIGGVTVKRIRTIGLPRYIPMARAMEYLLTAFILCVRALFVRKVDVALVHSPTLFEGVGAVVLRAIKGMPFVLNVHDIFPQTAIDLGLLKNRTVIRFFRRLERYIYRKADCITVHSEGNRDWIAAHYGDATPIHVMPIWMDPHVLKPGPRDNPWRQRQGLDGKFTVLFSGSQGYNQDMAVILHAAQRLSGDPEIEFVLVGNGAQHGDMVKLGQEMSLKNIRWLDWQPDEDYPLMLNASDVILSTLDHKVKTPVVPSKILSAMSAGRPVITCAPFSGDAPKLVARANAGLTLAPGNHEALAASILRLKNHPDAARQLGANGRLYVEEYLDVARWARAHIELFSALIASKGRASRERVESVSLGEPGRQVTGHP